MGRKCRCFMIVALVGLSTVIAIAGVLIFASRWLPDSDVAISADAIIVLAGDSRRTLYAADLYRRGLAPQVLLSRPISGVRERILKDMGIVLPDAEEYERMILLNKGVPAAAIDIFGSGSISTYEEGHVLSRRYAGQTPSLLAVTSPYHVRRARMILEDALPGARIHVVATPYEQFPGRWWTSQDAARDLMLELTKIIFYLVGGRYVAPTEQ
jgi:uncharacterized SAM-binding protein YcdF (DUF218 family)